MRVSIWRQDRKGTRWRRLGVVILDLRGALPFKKNIPCGKGQEFFTWPRLSWYPLERSELDLFDEKLRCEDVTRANGNT